jgi:3-keto-5-aminohexanoate cleavage enzyme
MQAVILEVALNGATSKRTNPNVPRATDELVADALACLELGATIVHTHSSEPGAPPERAAELYAEHYAPVLERRPDALLYPTIGAGSEPLERVRHFAILRESLGLRIGLLDPGSLNLGPADADGVPGATDFVYANSFATVRAHVEFLARERLGPSISIFEPGFLRAALAYHRAGRLPPGALVKLYFGGDAPGPTGARASGFGLPPTPRMLDVYLEMLEGSGLPWAVAALGDDVIATGLARRALERGGHLRVGLEDHAGAEAPANAELVREAAKLCAEVGRPLATPCEGAALLGLPNGSS